MLLSDLVPFYSEYSSYGSVMEGCEFAEVVLCEIPGLAAPEESVERACYLFSGGVERWPRFDYSSLSWLSNFALLLFLFVFILLLLNYDLFDKVILFL